MVRKICVYGKNIVILQRKSTLEGYVSSLVVDFRTY